MLADLIAPNGVDSFESEEYSRPVNSVELAHSEFANCGKYIFTLLTEDSDIFIEDWLEVISTEEGLFSLKLEQNPLYTKEVLVDLQIEIMLVDYP